MKRIVFLTVCAIVAITGVSIALVNHYTDYTNNKNAQKVAAQNSQITSLQSQLTVEKQTSARYEEAYQAQRLECEKGAGNVAKVPTYLQKGLIAPKCGPAVLAQ